MDISANAFEKLVFGSDVFGGDLDEFDRIQDSGFRIQGKNLRCSS